MTTALPCIVIVGGRYKAGGRPCLHPDVRHVEEDPTVPGRLSTPLCLDCHAANVQLNKDLLDHMGGRDHHYSGRAPRRSVPAAAP